jgi:hypothetical protein
MQDRFFLTADVPPRIGVDQLLDDAILAMNRATADAFLMPSALLGGTYSNTVAEASAISAAAITAMIRDLPKLMSPRPAQTRIVYSPCALESTSERLFPESKNRSNRIRKKLIKRFGGEFRQVPCMWQLGDIIYAHPSFQPQLEASSKETGAIGLA